MLKCIAAIAGGIAAPERRDSNLVCLEAWIWIFIDFHGSRGIGIFTDVHVFSLFFLFQPWISENLAKLGTTIKGRAAAPIEPLVDSRLASCIDFHRFSWISEHGCFISKGQLAALIETFGRFHAGFFSSEDPHHISWILIDFL